MAEKDVIIAVNPGSFAVGPAMRECVNHFAEDRRFGVSNVTGYSAHERLAFGVRRPAFGVRCSAFKVRWAR
jgi:hypothetical protein